MVVGPVGRTDGAAVVARGGVVMDRGPSRFTCVELRYNLRSKSGMFIDAAGDIVEEGDLLVELASDTIKERLEDPARLLLQV